MLADHQLCVDTRSHLEDLPKAMADRDRWQENTQKTLFNTQ